MRGRVGYWKMLAVAGLAGLLPTFFSLLPFARGPARRSVQPRPPACLEVWVRLRSYRGCPVLAAAAGYRLEIHCFWGGHLERSDGALVFAGPFAGRAYMSERPVPLGRWVHLAGIEDRGSLPADQGPNRSEPSTAAVRSEESTVAVIAFDGRDVTAGRMTAGAAPLPLGYDPADWRPTWARAPAAPAGSRGPAVDSGRADPAWAGAPVQVDGEIGAWRLSRGWRGLAEVAAARGSSGRWAPQPRASPTTPSGPGGTVPGIDGPHRGGPQEAAPGPEVAGPPAGRITARGWAILAAALLAALMMVGAGMAFHVWHTARPGTVGGWRSTPFRK